MSGGGANTDAYAGAANALTGAGNAATGAIDAYSNVPTIASGMSTYMNPYTNEVIGNATNDVNRLTQMQQQQNAASAARSGAFGGSRHGLVEATTNSEAQRNIGNLSGDLRMQGFNTAANLAGGDIANRFTGASGMLSGAGTLANLGTSAFNMGNTLETNQYNRGMDQQRMEQQKLNDAMAMFTNYTGAPADYLQMLTGALSGSPLANATNTTSTNSYKPGVMDFLSLFSGLKGL
jgi:hypothetical protein